MLIQQRAQQGNTFLVALSGQTIGITAHEQGESEANGQEQISKLEEGFQRNVYHGEIEYMILWCKSKLNF